MPEMNFYINDNERKELFDFLISNNGELTPAKLTNTPKLETVTNSDDFLDIIQNEVVRFYITSKEFSIQNFLIERNQFYEEPKYTIMQRYGGPYINLSLYRGFADDAKVKFKRTDLHHYPKYINLDNNHEEFKASEELKEYFNRIVKFLKAKCKNVTVDGKKFWISKEVIKELGISSSEKTD